DFSKVTVHKCRGDSVVRRQVDQLGTPAVKKDVDADEDRVGPLVRKSGEGRIDLAAGAGVEDLDLQSHCAGGRLHVSQRGLRSRSKGRSEEHTSELQSLTNLVCRLLLEKKKKQHTTQLLQRQPPNP